jgi:hypothetical protein
VRVGACVVLLAGAGLSTVQYVAFWHADFDAKVYTRNVAASARLHDVRVVDVWVPPTVVSPLRLPDNYVSRVFRPLPQVHAQTSGTDLQVLDELGIPRRAQVEPGLASRPGPVEGCGHAVKDTLETIDLVAPERGDPLESSWWVAVDYLAGADGEVTATFGEMQVRLPVRQGLHQFLARGEGPIDEATFEGRDSGLVLCVDKVTVGKVQVWDETQ